MNVWWWNGEVLSSRYLVKISVDEFLALKVLFGVYLLHAYFLSCFTYIILVHIFHNLTYA